MSFVREKRFLKFWFPVLVYSGIIFSVSSIPDLKTPSVAGLSDKVYHFLEYGFFSLLVVRAFYGTTDFKWKKILLWAVVFCAVYAVSDEFHQYFVPGRECDFLDWLADVSGSITGSLIYVTSQAIQSRSL